MPEHLVSWGLAVLALIALTAAETHRRIGRTIQLSDTESVAYHVQDRPDSLSGYRYGTRHIVASDRNDDLHWVVNAQRAIDDGTLRLRHVDYDNVPYGREVHWSSLYAWMIRAFAFGNVSKIEWSVISINLLCVILLAISLSWIVLRNMGLSPALGVLAAMASLVAFRDTYKFGVGDHHALVGMVSMAGTLFFIMGTFRLNESDSAKRRAKTFALYSSVSFAVGLWLNVVSVVPVLIGLGLSLLALAILARGGEGGRRSQGLSEMVSLWGRVGAIAALVAYAIEYAPGHFGMRLEANHPLYALAWFGGAELLSQRFRFNWREMLKSPRCWIGFGLLLQLPLVALLFQSSVFQVADPFLKAVHERYIMEFRSLAANASMMDAPLRAVAMGFPFLILAIAGVLAFHSGNAGKRQWALVLAVGPAGVLFLLALYQARWLAMSAVLLVPVLIALVGNGKGSKAPAWARAVAWISLLPGFLVFVAGAFADAPVALKERTRVEEKRIAHMLRYRVGESELVALGSPDATTNIIYYGGGSGVGTFYWENNEGLKRAARMLAAPSMDEARIRMAEAGVTHLVAYSWGGFEKEYLALHEEFGYEENQGKPFLMRLLEDQEYPLWLRPIPYRASDSSLGVALVFEVVPEMTEGEAVSRRFEYFLEMGLESAAFALEDRLRSWKSESEIARVAYCRLLALQQRRFEFSSEFRELYQAIENRRMEFEFADRIRYAELLVTAGHQDKARSTLLSLADEIELADYRRLLGGTVRAAEDLAIRLDLSQLSDVLRRFKRDRLSDGERI